MNLTDTQKKWIGYIVVVVAVLVAGLLGVTYPIPTPPLSLEVKSLQTANTVTLTCSPVNATPNHWLCMSSK